MQMEVFTFSMEHTMEFCLLQDRWGWCELIAGSEHTGEAALSLCWTERGVLQYTVALKNQDEYLLILQTSFPNSSQICTCTIQGHVFVIYFKGSSVQFLYQDCRLKKSENDDYIYRDQVQIIALFSLFYSDYHIFWCHLNFVFPIFRLLSNKILLVFILFKPLIQIKNFKSRIFHIWESKKWWQHYICCGTDNYSSGLSSDCFLPCLRRKQGY